MSFRTLCASRLSDELALLEDPVAQFTDTLIEIANKTIPKSHISKKKNSRKYRGLTMLINKLLKNGRRLNGNLFETLLQKTYLRLSSWKPKKTSGKVFVLHLDPKPNLKLSGKQSEKSKGKKSSSSLGHLKFNEKLVTDKKQIANMLASTISHSPSSQHYSTQCQAIKKHTQKSEKKLSYSPQTTQKTIINPFHF